MGDGVGFVARAAQFLGVRVVVLPVGFFVVVARCLARSLLVLAIVLAGFGFQRTDGWFHHSILLMIMIRISSRRIGGWWWFPRVHPFRVRVVVVIVAE